MNCPEHTLFWVDDRLILSMAYLSTIDLHLIEVGRKPYLSIERERVAPKQAIMDRGLQRHQMHKGLRT